MVSARSTLTLLLLLAVCPAAAQVRVLASVSETTIGAEETIAYTLEIGGVSGNEVQTPQPPQTDGLVLARSFPSTQRNVSVVNGQVSQSVAYSWVYRPTREGTVMFAEVDVRIGDQTYRAMPIKVKVVPQSQRAQRQAAPQTADPFALLRPAPAPSPEPTAPEPSDLFIRVIPSASSAYRNQQVAVNYQLFFREGIQLRQSRLTDSWDAEGFWREELDVDGRPIPQVVVENGLRYNMITLKRAAVFPTRAGRLTIDPLKIESEAVLPTRSRDPFEQFFSLRNRYTPVDLASPSLTITVRPLPDGAPDDFSGAVGSFRMDTRYDRTEVDVGSSIQLVVTVRGDGNIATLSAPVFTAPNAFEAYDPQVATDIRRSSSRMTGTKSFTYVLVPRSNGVYELPPPSMSYFDPTSRDYVRLSGEPTLIRVTGTSTVPASARAMINGLPVDDIAGAMVAVSSWDPVSAEPLHRRLLPYLLLGLPLLLLVGVVFVARQRQQLAADPSGARSRRAHPLARKHLRRAEALRVDGRVQAYYEELERAVLGFIGNRLNLAEQGLTRARLDETLSDAGLDEALRVDLVAFLDACDLARFAPLDPGFDSMGRDGETAARLLIELNGAFERRTA